MDAKKTTETHLRSVLACTENSFGNFTHDVNQSYYLITRI